MENIKNFQKKYKKDIMIRYVYVEKYYNLQNYL